MSNPKNIIRELSTDFRQITMPLLSENQITYFGFVRIYPDKSFINLVTTPEWSQYHYIEKKLPPAGLENFQDIKDQKLISLNENSDALSGWPQGTILELQERFNILSSFMIMNKYDSFLDVYGFTTSHHNPSEFLLTNLEYLESVIEYTKDKAATVIQHAEKSKLHYTNRLEVGIQPKAILPVKNKHHTLYYQNIAIRITQREYQVLSLLARGYRAKRVAQCLHISPRTVDEHVNNLRIKFDINSLEHIIEIFWKNKLTLL